MQFNLNQFLISVSSILDFIELDVLNDITNHGKRVGYIALKLGEKYNLSSKDKFVLLAFAIMHDIGAIENENEVDKTELEKKKSHCIIGEQSVKKFPFFNNYKNIILYHHENYDGSGFFAKEGKEIPLFSQIISLADYFELIYSPDKSRSELISEIKEKTGHKFDPELVNKFTELTNQESFWLNLKDQFILSAIKNESPSFSIDYSYQQIHTITALFSDIIDSKSEFTKFHSTELSKKAALMADFYEFDEEKKNKFIIAADLHDIGKLAISNSILDKPGKLTEEEFKTIKRHSYYTRKVLEPIDGFEDITEWAANHHEKNHGTGYPYGKAKDSLDFPSQIMVVLDIYQALTENRPYRDPMDHNQAMEILNDMVEEDKINSKITSDIGQVFSNSN